MASLLRTKLSVLFAIFLFFSPYLSSDFLVDAKKKKRRSQRYARRPDNYCFYSALQVRKNAKPREIDRAYAKLSKEFNPETSQRSNAGEILAKVEEAYEILSDREARQVYDIYGMRGFEVSACVTLSPPMFLSIFVSHFLLYYYFFLFAFLC